MNLKELYQLAKSKVEKGSSDYSNIDPGSRGAQTYKIRLTNTENGKMREQMTKPISTRRAREVLGQMEQGGRFKVEVWHHGQWNSLDSL